MFEEREVLSLGVWLCVAGFAWWQRRKLRLAIPHYPVLIISLALLSFSAFFWLELNYGVPGILPRWL